MGLKVNCAPVLTERVIEFQSQSLTPYVSIVRTPFRDNVDQEIISLMLDDARDKGLIEGATVIWTKLPSTGISSPHNWGIIVGHNSYFPKGSRSYHPIIVRWLSGSNQEMDIDELRVINPAPSKQFLKELCECMN
jgi:hypothetical protein